MFLILKLLICSLRKLFSTEGFALFHVFSFSEEIEGETKDCQQD